MKTWLHCKLITAAAIVMTVGGTRAEETNATKEVEVTIRRYFAAMSARDAGELHATLDRNFVVVEAWQDKARVHVVDSGAGQQILPPAGNRDWDTNNLMIDSIRVEVSETHPSVATASISVKRPLDAKIISGMQEMLGSNSAGLDENKRKTLAKWIAARAIDQSMLAMLARQESGWRIVCMSFPKK